MEISQASTCIHQTGSKVRGLSGIRSLKQTRDTSLTKTRDDDDSGNENVTNKRFNEQNNGRARAL